jgi:hypothetical protein
VRVGYPLSGQQSKLPAGLFVFGFRLHYHLDQAMAEQRVHGRRHPTIAIGARGWEHDPWAGSFYPVDLPQEWRLTYYNNEFHTVLVPAEHWADRPPEALAAWPAEVRPGFRFFLELADPQLDPDAFDPQALRANADALGALLGGMVLRLQAPPAVDRLEHLLEQLVPLPLALQARTELSVPHIELLAAHGAEVCWTPGAAMPHGGVGIIPAPGDGYTLRGLRAELEAFLVLAGEHARVHLFVEGEPPDLQIMRDGRAIAGLLGATAS